MYTVKGKAMNPEAVYGKSAYEIAVMHGFEGTEKEWLAHLETAQSETIEKSAEQVLSEIATDRQAALSDIEEAKAEMLTEIEMTADIVQTTGESATAVMSQKAVTNLILDESENKYNPALQTEETISPHYYVNGAPYETTQFDLSYNCSAPIYLNPNTTYTIGLVPAMDDGNSLPWGTTTSGMFFYKADGTYISSSYSNTFTTPEETSYIRFNYKIYDGYTLDEINLRCMIVKGDSLPTEYEAYWVQYHFAPENRISAVENRMSGVEDRMSGVESLVYYKSDNLYNPDLQTEETISPHYYVNGAPYETTQFDDSYNCTAPIEVEPDTQYTLALVPAVSGLTTPWGRATSGVFCYDENGNYLSHVGYTNTFTTHEDCKYIRFNYCIQAVEGFGGLEDTNSRCMLVLGDTIPTEYEEYYDTNVRGKMDELNETIDGLPRPISYKIEGGEIIVTSGYGEKNLKVTLNRHGGNNLFEFSRFSTVGDDGETLVQSIGTDWHAPFIVAAINDIDGDLPTSEHFTGGNHEYTNTGTGGTATARTTILRFFVDGRELTDGEGYANHIKILWTNLVQGYNTKKEDGTGREILQENHRLTFDGEKWTSEVDLIPLEDIRILRWYGLQFSGHGSEVYPNIRYKGAKNRGLYNYSATSLCGDNTTDAVVGFGEEHKITMSIDKTLDIGDSKYYSGIQRFFSSTYGKVYGFVIFDQYMYENEMYSLRGFYEFEPM